MGSREGQVVLQNRDVMSDDETFGPANLLSVLSDSRAEMHPPQLGETVPFSFSIQVEITEWENAYVCHSCYVKGHNKS